MAKVEDGELLLPRLVCRPLRTTPERGPCKQWEAAGKSDTKDGCLCRVILVVAGANPPTGARAAESALHRTLRKQIAAPHGGALRDGAAHVRTLRRRHAGRGRAARDA